MFHGNGVSRTKNLETRFFVKINIQMYEYLIDMLIKFSAIRLRAVRGGELLLDHLRPTFLLKVLLQSQGDVGVERQGSGPA